MDGDVDVPLDSIAADWENRALELDSAEHNRREQNWRNTIAAGKIAIFNATSRVAKWFIYMAGAGLGIWFGLILFHHVAPGWWSEDDLTRNIDLTRRIWDEVKDIAIGGLISAIALTRGLGLARKHFGGNDDD